MAQPFKTARCVLHRNGRYLLAVHSSFWGARHRRWGLPGGRIEQGETPESAIQREILEELDVRIGNLIEVGPYAYKKSLHMVFAAHLERDIDTYDDAELLDIGWFTEADVADLKGRGALHADYELEAIRALQHLLDA